MRSRETTPDRLREAFAALDPSTPPGETCPGPDRIWDAVRGLLEPAAVQEVVLHLSSCPSCAADWRLAKAGFVDALPVRKPLLRRWSAGLAAAAAVLVIGLLAVFQIGGPEPTYRDAGQGAVRSLLPDDEVLPRERAVLRWTSAGEGVVYDVEVGTLELEPLASGHELREPAFRIPADALDALPPGATIVWSVEALFPDGRREASEAFLTRIE